MIQDTVTASLTDAAYHQRAEATLAAIESTVDRLQDNDVIDIDAQRTGGLLELRFPNGSVIVVNTQPPLHELWLAARSGGFHFQAQGAGWRDTRNGKDFFDALSDCASEQGGVALRFDQPD